MLVVCCLGCVDSLLGQLAEQGPAFFQVSRESAQTCYGKMPPLNRIHLSLTASQRLCITKMEPGLRLPSRTTSTKLMPSRSLAPPVPQQRQYHPPGDSTQWSCGTQDPWGHRVHAPRQDYSVLRLPIRLHAVLCWWPDYSLPLSSTAVLWLHVVSNVTFGCFSSGSC